MYGGWDQDGDPRGVEVKTSPLSNDFKTLRQDGDPWAVEPKYTVAALMINRQSMTYIIDKMTWCDMMWCELHDWHDE